MSGFSTLFVSLPVPKSVKELSKTLVQLDLDVFEGTVDLGVSYLKGTQISATDYTVLKSKSALKAEEFDVLFSGLLLLLRHLVKLPFKSLKTNSLINELVNDFRLPANCVNVLITKLFSSERPDLQLQLKQAGIRLPRIAYISWRIDIAISSRSLSRILEPVIVININLNTGNVIYFECSLNDFHRLRYTITSGLKELNDTEERTSMMN